MRELERKGINVLHHLKQVPKLENEYDLMFRNVIKLNWAPSMHF